MVFRTQIKFSKTHEATGFSLILAGVGGAQCPLLRGAELGELSLPKAVIDSLANPLSKETWH